LVYGLHSRCVTMQCTVMRYFFFKTNVFNLFLSIFEMFNLIEGTNRQKHELFVAAV
jgi:hypothetical protein